MPPERKIEDRLLLCSAAYRKDALSALRRCFLPGCCQMDENRGFLEAYVHGIVTNFQEYSILIDNYTRKMYGPDGFYSWDADRGDIIYNSGTGHVAQVLHIGTDKKAYETCMVIHNYMREMGYKDELFNRGLR